MNTTAKIAGWLTEIRNRSEEERPEDFEFDEYFSASKITEFYNEDQDTEMSVFHISQALAEIRDNSWGIRVESKQLENNKKEWRVIKND